MEIFHSDSNEFKPLNGKDSIPNRCKLRLKKDKQGVESNRNEEGVTKKPKEEKKSKEKKGKTEKERPKKKSASLLTVYKLKGEIKEKSISDKETDKSHKLIRKSTSLLEKSEGKYNTENSVDSSSTESVSSVESSEKERRSRDGSSKEKKERKSLDGLPRSDKKSMRESESDSENAEEKGKGKSTLSDSIKTLVNKSPSKEELKKSPTRERREEKISSPSTRKFPKISFAMFRRTPSELKAIKRDGTAKQGMDKPPGLFFGVPLEKLMENQRESLPELKYPFILDQMLGIFEKANGFREEGIFRMTGLAMEVNTIKNAMNAGRWDVTTSNPHCAANLIRQWLKDLGHPLIPKEFYYKCLNSKTAEDSVKVLEEIPDINRTVICYFIRFLQKLTLPENIEYTMMGVNNIAIVFGPFFIYSPDSCTDSVQLTENERREQNFMKILIGNMKLGVEFDNQPPPEPPPPF